MRICNRYVHIHIRIYCHMYPYMYAYVSVHTIRSTHKDTLSDFCYTLYIELIEYIVRNKIEYITL
jgi:hypothetical protein